MMKFHIGYTGGEDKHGFSCFIHKAGCKDIKKTQYEFSYEYEGDLKGAISSYLDDELKAQGFDESIVKVFNCTG